MGRRLTSLGRTCCRVGLAFWTRRVSKGKELKKTLKEECDGVLEREIGWWRRESVARRDEVEA